ncbi:MAG: ribbon-helix-helix domain-containing protein [bacterium]|uniref:Ribbon-helix-helix domain-containing protein n=1 Tax=Candidatus Methylomirabilis tolerans TaxID=3123416 RepID=A0AAJ1AJN8_9BACT|nr:ribbon-helix-helix domain-containing protein [Candidatus Methylomirabilis sp.]
MVRTQIYLTEEEREGIDAIAKSTGKKQSEVIREAVDRFLALSKRSRREAILKDAAGMWRDRDDLPDFSAARRSWDRG